MPDCTRMLTRALLWALLLLLAPAAHAQWTMLDAPPPDAAALPAFSRPRAAQIVRIDWPTLERELAQAPHEDPNNWHAGLDFTLPLPTGQLTHVRIAQTPVMEPALAEQFPHFRAYRVIGITDPTMHGRFDVTSQGLRGLIRSEAGTFAIDPWSARQREIISAAYLADQPRGEFLENWSCSVTGEGEPIDPGAVDAMTESPVPPGPGVVIRQYRLAMACTGEFGVFHSTMQGNAPNVNDPLAAIVTMTNRVNAVFEAQLSMRFVLVANQTAVTFFDPATDPYPTVTCPDNATDCSSPYFNVNQGVVDAAIGNANYDVGHVVTRLPGGVAQLPSACQQGAKARAVSGLPRVGDTDPFAAFVVMHEIGHQFSAGHTFNGTLGRCTSGNRSFSSAWEPGSGSTIMAYTGVCPIGGAVGDPASDNIQIVRDLDFHLGNIQQITTHRTSPQIATCGVAVQTTNLPPTISPLPAFVNVPVGTPFTLTASAADPDSTTVASWESLDLGVAQRLTAPDNGGSPIFRIWPASALGLTRNFPNLGDVLGITRTAGERLPTFASNRRASVVVRDNQGGWAIAGPVQIRLANIPPFTVTSPAALTRWEPGSTVTIAWNTATTAAPFGVTEVDLSLSLDDGATFTPLGRFPFAPGTASFTLPAGQRTDVARVLLRPLGQVFYTVSPRFLVQPPCDSVDFNNDNVFPDDADLADYLRVVAGGACASCNDVDINNDGVFPDDADLGALLLLLGGGAC